MRVDNNWEDSIGKRLHDFEGDLSPQAWNNINKRIQPNRKNPYRWLPVLLCFLAIPGALYFTGNLEFDEKQNSGIAQNATSENAGNKTTVPTYVNSATSNISTENSSATNATELPENDMVSGSKTQADKLTTNLNATGTSRQINKQESGKNLEGNMLIAGAISSANHAAQTHPEKEKQIRKNLRSQENSPPANHTFAARSGNQQAGVLAFQADSKNDILSTKKTTSLENSNAAKTIGFEAEKVAGNVAKGSENSGSNLATSASENEINKAENSAIISKEIAALQVKNIMLDRAENALVTLPDTIKKQLLAVLPAPENASEKKADKKRVKTEKDWKFGIYGTPQYTFQRVQPNQNDGVMILKLDNKNAIETERFGFEFGARAYYPVRKNLQLEFGFQVANVNQHLQLITENNLADSAVVVQQGNTLTMQVYNRQQRENHLFKYYFGGLYTGANLQVSEKLELAGGLGLNWLLHSKTTTEASAKTNATVNPYLSVGLKYSLPLSDKLSLNAGPTMQYYLKAVQQKEAIIGVKPTTLGFAIGLQYKP